MTDPRPHPSPIRETRPRFRMLQPPRPQDINPSSAGPRVQKLPIHTFVRGAEIAERDGLRVTPAHGYEADVRVAG
ncbi:hypothetical protein G7Y79_00014g037010 [Physcia stellaris]|nr:hypothetical protein G7Y79_00014g037010 [Physcia stellaris]